MKPKSSHENRTINIAIYKKHHEFLNEQDANTVNIEI